MKKVIILLMVMIGWAGYALAQTDAESPATNLTEVQVSDGTMLTYEAPLFYMTEGITAFDRLRNALGYGYLWWSQHHENSKHVGSVEISDTTRLSRFQLIVDEHGNVEECTLVKSAQFSQGKDKTVQTFFLNNKIFDGPGYLNGKPCKSVAIITVRYYPNGDVHLNRKLSYPLIMLPDPDTEATGDTSSTNV